MIYAAYGDLADCMHLADDNSFEMSCARSVFSYFSTNLYFDVLESNCKPRVTQVSPGKVYPQISIRRSEFDWSIVLQR